MFRHLIGLVIIVSVLSSCRSNKDMLYLQGLDSLENHVNTYPKTDRYKVQVNDILYVKIISDNDEINKIYNSPIMSGEGVSHFDPVSMYFNGYNVNQDGIVYLPELGEVYVKDKDVLEIDDIITKFANKQIKDVEVIVKLASFKITFLGEVSNPGTYNFYQENTNILEALSICGDVTDYGNRKKIIIVRPTEDGSVTMTLDITDKSLLSSDLYYLKPNDLVYVESVNSKGIRLFAADYGVLVAIFSATTTAVVLILTLF